MQLLLRSTNISTHTKPRAAHIQHLGHRASGSQPCPRLGTQPDWAQTILGLPQAVCRLMERMWGPFLTWLGDSFELCIFPSFSFLHVSSRVLAATHKVTGIKEHLVERCKCFPACSWSEQSDQSYTFPSSCLHECSLDIMEQKTLLSSPCFCATLLLVQTRSWFNNLILVDLTFLTVQC